ncbi:hypothetical protein N7495_001975 [Penicillium taxi]|uniref:uncharacterized protein n=1 Tax=Penicillium taxi TaxID=168475 RepID=UPI002545835F|nr:uncharacterized protein N7495_001975 [Penicillium taxi]KAJ5901447.1 hypothetical protein N7495_001975 [Penicillium taxi]
MAGRDVRDPFCSHGFQYLAQRREERNWPPCLRNGVVFLVRLFERYNLYMFLLSRQLAFFQ